MQAEMKIPLAALIASSDDIYRKPRTGILIIITLRNVEFLHIQSK